MARDIQNNKKIIKALKAAFPFTIPVMLGYLFIGIAFGVMMSSNGFHYGLAILMSVVIFAGSMQYVAVSLLTGPFSLLTTFMMTLMINARHIFYGLSMLEPFKKLGKLKPYLIFALTDETYSLLCAVKPPEDVPEKWFLFFIALLDQSYWVTGTAIGAIASSLISFNTIGIDFAMTALFLVIFVEQWEGNHDHVPALLGLVITLVCLLTVGSQWFLLSAMAGIFVALTIMYQKQRNKKLE